MNQIFFWGGGGLCPLPPPGRPALLYKKSMNNHINPVVYISVKTQWVHDVFSMYLNGRFLVKPTTSQKDIIKMKSVQRLSPDT